MQDNYIELGKHWEWRPRMLLIGASVPARLPWNPGDPVALVHPVTITRVVAGRPWGRFNRIDGEEWGDYFFSDGRPDTDDPATRGCIAFDLLPKAWGPNAKISIHEDGIVCVRGNGITRSFSTSLEALKVAP